MSQYNELKALIDAQAKLIAQLQAEKANVKSDTLGDSFTASWKWAKDEGLLDGKNPGGVLTRQQASILLERYHKRHGRHCNCKS